MYIPRLQKKFLLTAILVMLGTSFSAWSETTAYVSDELNIALRSGDTTSHRIIKFIQSGTRLSVTGTNDDGSFSSVVTDDGKEGWVKTEYLMNERSARERLPALISKSNELKETVKELKKDKAELEKTVKKMEVDNATLAARIQELREVAAEPAAIADKNRRLTEQLEKVDILNAKLMADNERMANMDIKLWFIVGGGVALVSLVLGLIIPGFSWGRKKNSWGGGF